ncbi:MAG TPA: hypothetical protein V6D08_10055 [Candidatus Obscuribacterales bacterium]
MKIDWTLMADWVQAVGNTVVLIMIWFQMRQVQQQITQSDEQERFRRSWEFIRLFRDELREEDAALGTAVGEFDAMSADTDSQDFENQIRYFYKPRLHLFVLLNQLVQHQEVDERILFGYLEHEFNRFVEIGIRKYGREDFMKSTGARIQILLTLWGSQIKSSRLIYGT